MIDFEIRMHLCSRCGAPLEVPAQGGTVRCSYCDAPMTIVPRRVLQGGLLQPPSIRDSEEARRIQVLWRSWRAYDGNTDRYSLDNAPEGLDDIDGFDATDATAQRLQQELQVLLYTLASNRDAQRERRLFWVAQRLTNLWAMRHELLRRYATLETASEVLVDEGYRTILFNDLATVCLGTRNVDAAESWLVQCDSAPIDLSLDTSRRTSLAKLYHLRGDWNSVLDAIGRNAYEVPILPFSIASVNTTRAGCLEKLGLSSAAEAELMGAVRSVSEVTMEGNAEMAYEDLKDETWRRATIFIANLITPVSADRHSTYDGCLQIWQRLHERGHLPAHEEAACEFREQHA